MSSRNSITIAELAGLRARRKLREQAGTITSEFYDELRDKILNPICAHRLARKTANMSEKRESEITAEVLDRIVEYIESIERRVV